MAVHLVDVTKGTHIFQCPSLGNTYSTLILQAVEKIMYVTASDPVSALLNKRVQLGHSTYYTIAYLYCASRGLHYSILGSSATRFSPRYQRPTCCHLTRAFSNLVRRSFPGTSMILRSTTTVLTTTWCGRTPFTGLSLNYIY